MASWQVVLNAVKPNNNIYSHSAETPSSGKILRNGPLEWEPSASGV